MKSQEIKYVGIDCGKKTLEVIRIGENDVVGLEAGSQSFRIAKSILNKGIQVIVLNPGDLATIYQSLKNTDKEDSLKIERLIQRCLLYTADA
ncbi:IS110 family transposase, partial [Leptospira interrogans serovar Hardjo]